MTKTPLTKAMVGVFRREVQQRDKLSEAIQLIGRPPLTQTTVSAAEKKLHSLLSSVHVGKHAKIWLAVCQRIQGRDASDVFEQILREQPNNRFALVNLGASYLTSPDLYSREKPFELIATIGRYVEENHFDLFAGLVHALLVGSYLYDSDTCLVSLEQIYLVDKNYTPAISSMAKLLNNSVQYEAAIDYAKEAIAITPYNYQANHILSDRTGLKLDGVKYRECLEYVRFTLSPSNTNSILHAAYFLQDPFWFSYAEIK